MNPPITDAVAKPFLTLAALILPFIVLSPTASATLVEWTTASGGNGHFYGGVLFGADIDWVQAKLEAENRGGYLATITSAAEGNFIVSSVISDPFWQADIRGAGFTDLFGPWLGGFQPAGSPEPGGNWQWVTGESFSPTFWAAGEPNNINGEMHLHLYGKAGAKVNTWNDYANGNPSGGGNIRSFVVEYVPEPSAAILTAFGILGLAARRRRQAS